MSVVTCDSCSHFIDSDYDLECFMLDDTVCCERCRCQECGERKAERGIDQCWHCAAVELEDNPKAIEDYREGFRPTALGWLAQLLALRAKVLTNMGIKDDKAQMSQSASSPKVAPTAGGVTVPGVSHLSVRP